MAKAVSLYISDESFEVAKYLSRLAHKDVVWVLSQWIAHSKDESVRLHTGVGEHIETWRADQLRDFQRSLVAPDDSEDSDPPF